jgi:hypothetical protein
MVDRGQQQKDRHCRPDREGEQTLGHRRSSHRDRVVGQVGGGDRQGQRVAQHQHQDAFQGERQTDREVDDSQPAMPGSHWYRPGCHVADIHHYAPLIKTLTQLSAQLSLAGAEAVGQGTRSWGAKTPGSAAMV